MPFKKKPAKKPAKKNVAKKPGQGSSPLARLKGGLDGFFHSQSLGKTLLKVFLLAAIWGIVLLAGIVAYYGYELPTLIKHTNLKRHGAVVLEARDGTVFARYGDLHGDTLAVKDLPPHLIQAFLAVEDRRFYHHMGIDVWGLLRAMVRNAMAHHTVQGGSTITQQLAKNLFLGPERTFRRKVQEALLALWLEQHYSKDEILSAYLNRIYLGSGTFGVDGAAQLYFNKSARNVTLREACILAGLPRAPSHYSPLNDPGAAEERAKIVLQAMVDAGYLAKDQKGRTLAGVPLPSQKPGGGGDGHYFADWILEQLDGLIDTQDEDIIIRTTLDLPMQREAERQVDAMLAQHGSTNHVDQAALVSIGQTGAVRALVGGRDYALSPFNRATQAKRQPGSVFKPIVYLAALEQGATLSNTLLDAPLAVAGWQPENFHNQYKGIVSLQDALAYSLNTATIRLAQQTGIDSIRQLARKLGITTPLPRQLSLALGTGEVRLLDMTAVYAVFAAEGEKVMPYGIEAIHTNSGKKLYSHASTPAPPLVPENVAADLDTLLQAVVRYGTGQKAALAGGMVAGKTGTTQDSRDAWFIGYTKANRSKGTLTTGVWVGNDDNQPMKGVTGGTLPAQLWHDYMAAVEGGNEIAPPSLHTLRPPAPDAPDSFIRFLHNLFGDKLTVEHRYPR